MNRLVSIASILIGTALVSLALPRFLGAVLMIPGDPYMRDIQEAKPLSLEEIEISILSRRAAAQWVDSGRVKTDLGLAQLHMARQVGFHNKQGKQLLAQSRQSIRVGLGTAPANPFAWARLAYIEFLLEGRTKAVAEAVRMSIRSGQNEPSLILSRLRLAFLVWDKFDDSGKAGVARQVMLAWRKSKEQLLNLARRTNALPIINPILGRDLSSAPNTKEH